MIPNSSAAASNNLAKAQSLATQGNVAGAADSLKLIDPNALSSSEQAIAVRIAVAAREFEMAIAFLNVLIKARGKLPELLVQKADVLHKLGLTTEAITLDGDLISRNDDVAELHYNLALIHFDQQDIGLAETSLKRALSIDPTLNKATVLLARCQRAKYEFEHAESTLRKLLQTNSNTSTKYRLGRLCMHRHQTDEARELLEQVQRENPQWPPIYQAIATNEVFSGNAKAALQAIQQGLQFDLANLALLEMWADVCIEWGIDDPNAPYIAVLQRAVVPAVLLQLGRRLIKLNNLNLLNTLASRLSQVEQYKDVFTQLQAEISLRSGDYTAAMSLLDRLPKSAENLETQCKVLFAQGNYVKALELSEYLLKSSPSDVFNVAMYTTALKLNTRDEYRQWCNYDTLIKEVDITKTGTVSLAELKTSLNSKHRSVNAPLGQSVVGGTQTPGNLFAGYQNDQPLKHLLSEVHSARDGLVSDIAKQLSEEHWLNRYKPSELDVTASWSIRTRRAGFHESHVHSKGWYSSACYIDVPDCVGQNGNEGFIGFGKPPFKVKDELDYERVIKPEAGKLVLFPSYVFHGTIPFEGEGDRLVVAFDLGKPSTFV